MLNVQKISKSFFKNGKELSILRDISFSTKKGESISIVGPSGSGKTTLLSLLSGLDRPTKGKIDIGNETISKMNEKELAHFRSQSIGIVFQQFYLMPYLTAAENVALPLEIQKKKNSSKISQLALEKVGLSHRTAHFPSQLSGGECQRVAIARATVCKPQILFADEPSGNLDQKTGKIIIDLLFDLTEKENMTLVLVTHNEQLAKKCSRTLELLDGRIQ